MSFGEEPLTTPVVVARTSDQCHPTVLRIDGEAKTIRVEFFKGTGTAPFVQHANDNVTFRNLPDDEDGNPQAQEWDDFMAGTQIADFLRAQPAALTNGAVLKKLATYLLGLEGVI